MIAGSIRTLFGINTTREGDTDMTSASTDHAQPLTDEQLLQGAAGGPVSPMCLGITARTLDKPAHS